MLSRRPVLLLTTMLAPSLWGTTYIVFTQFLPESHPLLTGVLRALPAGLLLMLLGPGLPPREKLLPLTVLGLCNIGLFFGLLFVSAARLPGGVAATLMSAQPLIVALLAWPLLLRRPRLGQIAAAFAGFAGVGLLVLDPSAKLDLVGIAAALAAAASMALSTVLIERWGNLGTPLALAAWQLFLGGLILLPVALALEGLPPLPSARNLAGFLYLILPGTALAYWLWVRGITQLGAGVTFLSLLSPLVATLAGATWLGEWFTGLQFAGMALILVSTASGMFLSRQKSDKRHALPGRSQVPLRKSG